LLEKILPPLLFVLAFANPLEPAKLAKPLAVGAAGVLSFEPLPKALLLLELPKDPKPDCPNAGAGALDVEPGLPVLPDPHGDVLMPNCVD
jgi:hypothetical protein